MAEVEEATVLKQKGNKAFSNHDWLQAIDFYSQAIDVYDKDPSFFCNRSQVIAFVTSKSHSLVSNLYL